MTIISLLLNGPICEKTAKAIEKVTKQSINMADGNYFSFNAALQGDLIKYKNYTADGLEYLEVDFMMEDEHPVVLNEYLDEARVIIKDVFKLDGDIGIGEKSALTKYDYCS